MNENYQRYLELIENFYQSKNNYLGNKDKHSKCDGCETNIQFVESQKEIILNCGDTGKCGKKIEIILPKYIYKDKEIELLKSELEKVIDWNVINQHIKIDSKVLEDNKELIENNNKQIQEVKQKYYEIYKKNNVIEINEKYKEILKLKTEIKDIREKLLDISLSSEQKKILRNDYIDKNNNINQLYYEIRENKENIKEYFLESEPVVKIGDLGIISTQKKKVKKKKQKKVSLDDFEEGMNVEYISKDKKLRKGIITKIDPTKKKLVLVKVGKQEIDLPISKLTIVKKQVPKEVEEEPKEVEKEVEEEPKEVEKEVEEEPKEVEKEVEEEPKEVDEGQGQEIVVGSKVKWKDAKGKPFTGTIEAMTKDKSKCRICCKPGKKSGEKNALYLIPIEDVKLDQ